MRGTAHRRGRAAGGVLAAGRALASCVALSLAVSGCVGPNFVPPAAPAVDGYLPGKLASPNPGAGGPKVASQHFVSGEAVSARWWAAFQSEPLNQLIRDSVNHSPTLQAAEAAIKVAQYNAQAQRSAWAPQVSGNSQSQQILQSNAGSVFGGDLGAVPQTRFSLVTQQLTVSFTPDIWGANFRSVENLDAITEQQLFNLEEAYLTLTSQVVTAAIQEASLRGQIDATNQLIAINGKMLDILRRQLDKGFGTRGDVAVQEAALAQVKATLPPLRKALAQQRNLIAALSGSYASEGPRETFTLANLHLPADLPVSLPSQMIEQRPDVRAAEEQLHAASAQIGVATANLLPTFTINANGGYTNTLFSSLIAPQSLAWSLVGNATQTVFDGGTLLHQLQGANDTYQAAAWTYRGTVIDAVQNVADTLRAIQADADALRAARDFERAAKISLDLAQQQFDLGKTNVLLLLTAEQTYLQAKIQVVQAQAARLSDTAALFQALGGGWWNRAVPTVEKKLDVGTGATTPIDATDRHEPGLRAYREIFAPD